MDALLSYYIYEKNTEIIDFINFNKGNVKDPKDLIEYLKSGIKDFDLYQNDFAPKLQQEHASKYAGKFAAFRTMLSMVAQF